MAAGRTSGEQMNAKLALVCALLSFGAALATASAESAASDTSSPPLHDSILVNPRANWRLSSLRPEIRHRVHVTASKVPRFPHEDPRLKDPRKWPEVMLIGGEMLRRKIEYLDVDYSQEVRSMNDVPLGSDYTLRYGNGRGPVYTWSRGTLVERSWRGGGKLPPATSLYIYYSSGELMRFEYRSNGYNKETSPANRPIFSKRCLRATGRF